MPLRFLAARAVNANLAESSPLTSSLSQRSLPRNPLFNPAQIRTSAVSLFRTTPSPNQTSNIQPNPAIPASAAASAPASAAGQSVRRPLASRGPIADTAAQQWRFPPSCQPNAASQSRTRPPASFNLPPNIGLRPTSLPAPNFVRTQRVGRLFNESALFRPLLAIPEHSIARFEPWNLNAAPSTIPSVTGPPDTIAAYAPRIIECIAHQSRRRAEQAVRVARMEVRKRRHAQIAEQVAALRQEADALVVAHELETRAYYDAAARFSAEQTAFTKVMSQLNPNLQPHGIRLHLSNQ